MDSRYTNRDKYLDSLSNKDIAHLILDSVMVNFSLCMNICPVHKIEKCVHKNDCFHRIEKWLGEYADD